MIRRVVGLSEPRGARAHPNPSLAFKLRIFGSDTTDFARCVKEIVAERGLSTFVEWCGYKPTQDEIYPEVDFTLVPTLTAEPLGLAAIEPAVYGKPSITSTAGGLAEIVLDGVTGYQVAPNDATALADRMAKLLLDPALVKRLGQAAHAQALSRFDTDVVMDQYEALIARLTH